MKFRRLLWRWLVQRRLPLRVDERTLEEQEAATERLLAKLRRHNGDEQSGHE